MKVFSKTHVIHANAAAAVVTPKGPNGKTLKDADQYVYAHPAGTILEMSDDEGSDLIARGFAEEYKPEEFKDSKVDPLKDGKVDVTPGGVAVTDTLPEGASRPSVVRQDGTENVDASGAGNTKPGFDGGIVRDMRHDAATDASAAAALKAEQARAGAGIVTPPGGNAQPAPVVPASSTAANPPKTVDENVK